TPADLRLRQAYVQVCQIKSLRGQAPGQAHVSAGPSWAPDVGLQVLQRTVKTLRAPLPSRLHEQILHLQGAQWLGRAWQLSTPGRHAQRRLLDTRQQAMRPASLGCLRARGKHANSRLQAYGSTHLLYLALQSPLLQTYIGIKIDAGIRPLHL